MREGRGGEKGKKWKLGMVVETRYIFRVKIGELFCSAHTQRNDQELSGC